MMTTELALRFLLKKKSQSDALNYWFCAEDENGQPVVLMDKKVLQSKDYKLIKRGAKSKHFSKGTVFVDPESVLIFVPDGRAPGSMGKAVKKIARGLNVKFKGIRIGEDVVEDDDVETATPPPSEPKERKLATKALDEVYKGEDKSVAWRADHMDRSQKTPEEIERIRASTSTTTKYYNEDEKRQSAVQVDDQGRLLDSDGKLMDGDHGYVIDPSTGKAHAFKKGKDEEGSKPGHVKTVHHSSPLAGGDVAGAGHIQTEDGRLKEVSDLSGHYKPNAELVFQALELMLKQGISFHDTRVADEDGDFEGNEEYIKDITAELEEHAAKLATIKAEGQKLLSQQKGATPERLEELEGLLEDNKDEHERFAKKVAKRLNIIRNTAPANKPAEVSISGKAGISESEFDDAQDTPDANADVKLAKINDFIEAKTGLKDFLTFAPTGDPKRKQIRPNLLNSRAAINLLIGEATKIVLTTDQFMQTGGNETAIRAKAQANEQIEDAAHQKRKQRIKSLFEKLGVDSEIAALQKLGVSAKQAARFNDKMKYALIVGSGGNIDSSEHKLALEAVLTNYGKKYGEVDALEEEMRRKGFEFGELPTPEEVNQAASEFTARALWDALCEPDYREKFPAEMNDIYPQNLQHTYKAVLLSEDLAKRYALGEIDLVKLFKKLDAYGKFLG